MITHSSIMSATTTTPEFLENTAVPQVICLSRYQMYLPWSPVFTKYEGLVVWIFIVAQQHLYPFVLIIDVCISANMWFQIGLVSHKRHELKNSCYLSP